MRVRSFVLVVVMALAAVTACGGASDPAPTPTAPAPPALPETSAPTTAPAGACTWTIEADESETQVPDDAAPAPPEAGPDVAPHEAENNAWRERGGLTPLQVADGTNLAQQLQPALIGSCEQGDFSPDRLATALEAAVPDGWTVFTTQPRSAAGDPSTRIQIALEHQGTCLIGATAPGAVQLRVTAPIADGGCWEPPAH